MTAPDTTNFAWRVERGEREEITFPVVNADGDLFSIEGWTIDAKIKTRPGGDTLYTWPAELATFDSDDNTISLVIPAPVSAAWTFTTGWYRVLITDPTTGSADPFTYRVLAGVFVVDPD